MKLCRLQHVAGLSVVLLATASVGWTDAGDCLSIWVDLQGQPAECGVVQMREQLDHLPDVCLAESARKAVIRVKLTSCQQDPKTAIPVPATPLIEHVVKATVSKGKSTRELTGRDDHDWKGAVADLCRAIVAWHGGQD